MKRLRLESQDLKEATEPLRYSSPGSSTLAPVVLRVLDAQCVVGHQGRADLFRSCKSTAWPSPPAPSARSEPVPT